jgi:hypothetical protein
MFRLYLVFFLFSQNLFSQERVDSGTHHLID